MPWLTAKDEKTSELWPGAFDLTESELETYLEAARVQCEAFAPALPENTEPPANYILAQALQARAIARATIAGSGDTLGGYGDTVTVFPMDWTVKNLLRPKKGRPIIA